MEVKIKSKEKEINIKFFLQNREFISLYPVEDT